MDIYTTLKKDHRKVSALMKEVLATTSAAEREAIFDEINEELTLHSEAEAASFYAALEREQETEEKIEYAEEDHEEIKKYLRKLSSMSATGEKWLELFGEFRHAVEHHVKDEEERIFPYAQQILSDEEAEELGQEMARLKEEAMEVAA